MKEAFDNPDAEKNIRDTFSEKKHCLWIVTELYYPEVTSTGYYLTQIAEGLAGNFRVKVLCGQPNYSARGVRSPKKECHKGVEIHRIWGTTLDKNVIFFRLINMLTLSFGIFVKALINFRKNERVLVVTTPPSLPFISALAAIVRKASYTLLIHDNYPEILVAVGKTKENSKFVKFIDFFNRLLYRYADKIIVVGRDMKKLVEEKTRGLNVTIEYIPNWAELEQVEPVDRQENKLLAELGITDKFVFLYAGNMGYPNDLESIVECAKQLKKNEEFHFIFLGAGIKKKWLEREVSANEISNITILDPRPRSEQNTFLNACDVALVSLVKKMRGVSMPSRTYNILAAGKPILALTEGESELALVVNEDEVGWVVAPDDPENLLRVLYEIRLNRHRLPEMQRNSRSAALRKYSSEQAIEKYRKCLK